MVLRRALYILDKNQLFGTCDINIFSHLCIFNDISILNFNRVVLSIFFPLRLMTCFCLRKSTYLFNSCRQFSILILKTVYDCLHMQVHNSHRIEFCVWCEVRVQFLFPYRCPGILECLSKVEHNKTTSSRRAKSICEAKSKPSLKGDCDTRHFR